MRTTAVGAGCSLHEARPRSKRSSLAKGRILPCPQARTVPAHLRGGQGPRGAGWHSGPAEGATISPGTEEFVTASPAEATPC